MGSDSVDVLQVVSTASRRGAERFAAQLGAELASRGVDVETVALVPGRPPRHDLPVLGGRRTSVAGAVRLVARMSRASVVIAHGSATLPACGVANAIARSRYIYRSIGDPVYWSGTGFRRVRSAFFLRRARAVVALWPDAARLLHDVYGVDQRAIHVIPNAVDGRGLRPASARERATARENLGVAATPAVVAYVGALSEEKNVSTALDALARLPDAHLLLAGDGAQRRQLEAIARARMPGRAHFLGSLADVRPVYAAADVVVLPSRSEGMPAVLIEAGLCGLPVVATDVGGVGTIVLDGETGRLVPPGDPTALADAISHALAERPSLGRAARTRCCEHFDLRVVANQWQSLVEEVGR